MSKIEVEQAAVAANRELIARLEVKIQVMLARTWGEDGPAIPKARAPIKAAPPLADPSQQATGELLRH